MEITALLESLDTGDFRATSVYPLQVVTQAATREEALEQLRQVVSRRLARAEIVRLYVPVRGEGGLRDHPDWDEVEENMWQYRREVDADEGRP
jgi:hypothetical protein